MTDKKWIKANLWKLSNRYPGRFIAIQDRKVIGDWGTLKDAQAATKHLHPNSYTRVVGVTGWGATAISMQTVVRRWCASQIVAPWRVSVGVPPEPPAPGFLTLFWRLIWAPAIGEWPFAAETEVEAVAFECKDYVFLPFLDCYYY